LFEFGKLLGLYTEKELQNEKLERLVVEGGRTGEFYGDKFWTEISGEDVRVYGRKRVWKIKDPVLQILHKILVKSVFHREYFEQYVLDPELFIMYVYVMDKNLSGLNFTWLIALHLCYKAVTDGGSRICCGHLVSRIARSLGLFKKEEMELFGKPILCKSVELKSFGYLRDDETGLIKGLPEALEVEPLGTMEE
jgi:hypothetical protein